MRHLPLFIIVHEDAQGCLKKIVGECEIYETQAERIAILLEKENPKDDICVYKILIDKTKLEALLEDDV